MAFEKCKECGSKIGWIASKCPQCGKTRSTALAWVVAFLGAIIGYIVVSFVFSKMSF